MAKLKVGRAASLAKKTAPFAYQQEAIDTLRSLPTAALFFEQGLGKTKIAIDVALDWLSGDEIDTVLIVTKKGLVKNWTDEFKIHSHVRPRTLSSDRTANHRAFFSAARIFVTNYEAIAVEEDRIATFAKHRRIGIILDESQKIKNPKSALTQSFLRLARCFKRRLIMTGTPIANRPFDIWSQVFFLDEGAALGTDFDSFKAKLDFQGATSGDAFEAELISILPAISSFTLRETKAGSGLNLPGKEFVSEIATWEPRQREMYDLIRKELRISVRRDGKPVVDETDLLLKRLLRLVQVTANPAIIDQAYDREPGKFPVLRRLVDEVVAAGEKTIVWTSFVKNCMYLRRELEPYGVAQVHGQMSIDDRNRSIDRFKRDESTTILVATPAAAKEGLTLTVANHVIFYDRSFSLDDYVQAQDRIHRISQERDCYVHNIMMKDSIDEWIGALIQLKSAAARVGLGDVELGELREATAQNIDEILKAVLHG